MPVDLPTGIKGTASTLIRSEVTAAYRAGDERTGRPIRPVVFLRRDQTVSERDRPAVGLGEKVVANDGSAYGHRWNDTFNRVGATYLAGATCVGLDVLTAGVAIE